MWGVGVLLDVVHFVGYEDREYKSNIILLGQEKEE